MKNTNKTKERRAKEQRERHPRISGSRVSPAKGAVLFGYVLCGKFLTPKRASRLRRQFPDLIEKFRKAVRRSDGTIIEVA